MALKLIHTSTLRLEPFMGQRIPDYAILSHTWVEGDEISYEDMIDISQNPSHPGIQKSGYLKILKTCEIARQAGLEYAWVDTCCIDKSSSTDLSEAINSMFRWYQAAKVCFAYLSDLPPTSNLHIRMPRCKWFTRGWCLQELIAPRDVRFYNDRWECIGSKLDTHLRCLVSRISKIDEAVLADASTLSMFSVAQKMSWGAHRETTKPEDIAYCLLGIFDVNMPLLYGEGQKAFMRLQEEVIKQSNDLSIFAWGHPVTTRPRHLEVNGLTRHVEEEEENNKQSVDQTTCCELFAESPNDFSTCGNLVLQTAATQRNFAFSMTNNGLLLSRVKLRVNFEHGCYLLPLLCHEKGSPLDGTYLALQKIAPDLFVRLHHCHWENLFRWNQRVDGYIVNKITHEIRTFVEECQVESVQLHSSSCSKEALHASILEISPQETWDPSRLAFLHDHDHRFSGYVKFNGRMLRAAITGSVGPGGDDFYLAWGGLDLADSAEYNNVRETVWVRLYWAGLGDHVFMDRELDNLSGLETDSIRRGSDVITANVISMGDLGSEYSRINIGVAST